MPTPDPIDPAIEAAAKRAYEAFVAVAADDGTPCRWADRTNAMSAAWLAVALAAQPPPKLCGTCRFWGWKPADGLCGITVGRCHEPRFPAIGVCTWAEFGCQLHEPTEESQPPA